MNTTAHLEAIRVVSYYTSGDESAVKVLLSPATDIIKKYLEPFRRELDVNLIAMESSNGKRDLLKYYVFEFAELQGFFEGYEYIVNGTYSNIGKQPKYMLHESNQNRKLDRFENYVVVCSILVNMLFEEIQLCCFKYNVDFFEICEELDFKPFFIDTSVSSFRREKGKKNQSGKEGFQSLLEKNNDAIYRYLLRSYKNCKPETAAYMIFALSEMNVLVPGALENQTLLHSLLRQSFGKIGTRQNLNYNITKLRSPDVYQKRQVELHKQEIKKAIQKK